MGPVEVRVTRAVVCLVAVAGAIAVFACGSLPDIAGGCGNSLVEIGEDCDRFGDSVTSATCRAPGSEGECRFDCTSAPDAGPFAQKCPAGFSCGRDFICRKPAGKYTEGTKISSLADRVLIADFDGDRINDILARTRVDLTVYYGDPTAKFGTTFTIPAADVSPVAGLLTAEPDTAHAADIAYGISNLGGPITVWQGQSDRTLTATPYAALTFPGRKDLAFQPRFLSVEALSKQPAQEVVVFVPAPSGSGMEVRLTNIGVGGSSGEVGLGVLGSSPSTIVALEKGQIIEDPVTSPCDEIVVATAGDTAVHVLTPCSGSNANGLAANAPPGGHIAPTDVQLDSGKVASGLHLLDLNADGRLDLMVDVAGLADPSVKTVQVAFGNGNGTFGSTVGATDNKTAVSSIMTPYPLAIGQLTNDGLLDFVLPATISITRGGGDAGAAQTYHVNAPRGVLWNEAHILDLNGDGTLDIIAGSATGSIDLYTNGPDGLLNHSTYAADGPTGNFVFGDFDGDYNIDTAFIAYGVGGNDTLSIMFGRQRAAPQAPVRITHFEHVEQLGTGVLQTSVNGSAPDAVTDLGVVWRDADGNQQFISLLQGSTDRQIQAPFSLSLGIGAPSASAALGLALGRFTPDKDGQSLDNPHLDIAAVGVGTTVDNQLTVRFWRTQLVGQAALAEDDPALSTRPMTASAPVDTYDRAAAVQPGAIKPKQDWTRVQLASVGLDGPKGALDAFVVLAPPIFDSVGTLYVQHAIGGVFTDLVGPIGLGPDRKDKRGSWQLGAVDLNDDLAKEIVVFADGTDAKVKVFWNRSKGTFDTNAASVDLPVKFPMCKRHTVEACARPIGFAAVNADSDPQKELFILTAEFVFSAKNTPGSDELKVAEVPVIEIPAGIEPTSIAAGDIDGDGIDDVVVTSARALQVFTGECAGVNCEKRVLK